MSTKPVLLINGNPVGQVGGEGGGGGHTIIDSSGSSLAQESGLQFADAFVSDDSTDSRTVVEVISESTQSDFDDLDETDAANEGLYAIDYAGDAPLLTDNMIGHDATHTVREVLNGLEDFGSPVELAKTNSTDSSILTTLSESVNNFRYILFEVTNGYGALFMSQIVPVSQVKTRTSGANSINLRCYDGAMWINLYMQYSDDTHVYLASSTSSYNVIMYGIK